MTQVITNWCFVIAILGLCVCQWQSIKVAKALQAQIDWLREKVR